MAPIPCAISRRRILRNSNFFSILLLLLIVIFWVPPVQVFNLLKDLDYKQRKGNMTAKDMLELKTQNIEEVTDNKVAPSIRQDYADINHSENIIEEMPISPPESNHADAIAVLIMAGNRPSVRRCLNSVFKFLKKDRFRVFVSQDGSHSSTTEAIDKFDDRIIHIKQPVSEDPGVERKNRKYLNYYKISRHYKWALNAVFYQHGYQQIIILEDDMEIGPDFFEYFEAFLPLLHEDKTLICISAWNDNGKSELISDPFAFYRSDFFPGLGWMLTKALWNEIEPKWPLSFWDDWLRLPEQRNNRACIRPEISRVKNFGKVGVSAGQFFDQHISQVVMNDYVVPFSTEKSNPEIYIKHVDPSNFSREMYDRSLFKQVYDLSRETNTDDLRGLLESDQPRIHKLYPNNSNLASINEEEIDVTTGQLKIDSIRYCGNECFRRFVIIYGKNRISGRENLYQLTKSWNLMSDTKAGIFRTSYHGIICFKKKLKAAVENRVSDLISHSLDISSEESTFERFISICLAPEKSSLRTQTDNI